MQVFFRKFLHFVFYGGIGMLNVLYEDDDLIVVVKPAGVESQSARRFAPDMISGIKKHLVIDKLCTESREPYVAVIHRLDKPVSGVMVYAKTKNAAAALSAQIQDHRMKKTYQAVACGKPANNVDNYVDYLLKSEKENESRVVEKGITGAKRAELSYRVIESSNSLSLIEIDLKTGRHHQIRVQFSAHGTPVYGDRKYGVQNPVVGAGQEAHGRPVPQEPLALCAASLSFFHPKTGKAMEFSIRPSGGAFEKFCHKE